MGETKKKLVIDNLEELADKIMSFIASESVASCEQLVAIINKAKDKYQKPIEESWLTSFFYQHTRVRGTEATKAINGMTAFPGAINRLQEFQLLVGKGGWESTSFNTYFFKELIKAMPGYDNNDGELPLENITRLKTLIFNSISDYIIHYQATKKDIAHRQEELNAAIPTKKISYDHVQLFDDPDQAQAKATAEPEKIVYCLQQDNDQLKLSWFDFMGESFSLKPGEELIQLIADQNKVEDESSISFTMKPLLLRRVIIECEKARKVLFDKTQVLVNPKDIKSNTEQSTEELIAKGVSSSFILRGKPGEYSLCWVDTLSRVKEIPLEEHPKLKDRLDNSSFSTKSDSDGLKTLLLHMKINSSLEANDFKAKLEELFQGKLKGKRSYHENVGKLDMERFSEIERCLKSRNNKESDQEINQEAEEMPGRLYLSKFSKVSSLFQTKPNHLVTEELSQDSLSLSH